MEDDEALQQAIALSLAEPRGRQGEEEPRAQQQAGQGEAEPKAPQPEEAGQPEAKRRRSDEGAVEDVDDELVLAAPGETRRVRLPASTAAGHRRLPALTVEHGSSLSMISTATTMLHDEFNNMDPEEDWKKWQALGATLYFFAVTEESEAGGAGGAAAPPLTGDVAARAARSYYDASQPGYSMQSVMYVHQNAQDGDQAECSVRYSWVCSDADVIANELQGESSGIYLARFLFEWRAGRWVATKLDLSLGREDKDGEMLLSTRGRPACVLRTVLDGDFSSSGSADSLQPCLSQGTRDGDSPLCPRRVIIDYLMTSEHARGRGYAARLLDCAREMARRSSANLLVLAIEESCPYWMNQGFILEEGRINQRVNCFPDTHLLKLPSNREDVFPEAEEAEEEEDDGEDEGEGEEGDDELLQNALLASLAQPQPAAAHSAGPGAGSGTTIDLTQPSESQAALDLTNETAESVRRDAQQMVEQEEEDEDEDDDDEDEDGDGEGSDEELARAIALSLQSAAGAAPAADTADDDL